MQVLFVMGILFFISLADDAQSEARRIRKKHNIK